MAYELLAPMVQVFDQHGKLHQHYRDAAAGGASRGRLIPWLSDEQREHFLRHRLVRELSAGEVLVDDERTPAALPAGAPDDLVAECVRLLDQLRDEDGPVVPSSAGRPACADALRRAGYAFGNDVIAAAVRYRKNR